MITNIEGRLSTSQTEVQLAITAATEALIAAQQLKVQVQISTISQTLVAQVQALPAIQTAAQTKVTTAIRTVMQTIEAAQRVVFQAQQLISDQRIQNETVSRARTIRENASALNPIIAEAQTKLTQMSQLKTQIDALIAAQAPLVTQNFSNTTILEPFWNNAQTRAESVRNAEAINNNTLPIGIYSSKNMSMYASIRY